MQQNLSGEVLSPDEGNLHFVNNLQETNFQNNQLIQLLAAAVYTCDTNGFITFYNKAAADLWGRVPELGKDLWCGSWKIYHPDGKPMPLHDCPMAITLKEHRPVRGQEIIVERSDGQMRHIMPHPEPIFDSKGELAGAVNMLVDITALRMQEAAIRESNEKYKKLSEELEVLVEERTRELTAVNASLLRSNLELEQFAFIASHDMQEPLRKINNYAQRLEKTNGMSLDETGKLYLDKINNSASRMSILIKDVLEYSRTGGDAHEFFNTDLNSVMEKELEDFEWLIEHKEAFVKLERLPVIKAIPLQMSQLFHNLLSNSIKFSRSDTRCIIEITARPASDKMIADLKLDDATRYTEIIISDNGIGFSQEYAESIFKIFERLHGHEQYEGTGIGLALCRKIVNLHQGEIFASSVENKGTEIHVVLPLAT